MDKKLVFNLLKFAAILGNILFILWISYNAIDEGFRGTIYQVISGIGIILLLALNSVLLFLKGSRSDH
ncbi:MAG: hypothetical protein P4L50_18135 [Anaerolineaceae bacterium]|nr:hypothetical protein [Anaerolineaceae bacterium]